MPAVAPDKADTEVRQYSSTAALPLTATSLMNCGPSRLAARLAILPLQLEWPTAEKEPRQRVLKKTITIHYWQTTEPFY